MLKGRVLTQSTLQLMSLIPTISFQLQENSFFGTWCNTIAAFHTHTTVYSSGSQHGSTPHRVHWCDWRGLGAKDDWTKALALWASELKWSQVCSGAGTRVNGAPILLHTLFYNKVEAVSKWLVFWCVPTSFLLVLQPWMELNFLNHNVFISPHGAQSGFQLWLGGARRKILGPTRLRNQSVLLKWEPVCSLREECVNFGRKLAQGRNREEKSVC